MEIISMPKASPSQFHRRAERCLAALRLTDDSLADAIGAMPEAADGLVARLLHHRETAARLTREASILIEGMGKMFGGVEPLGATAQAKAGCDIATLERAVQILIGDATADELSRTISHGEE